MASLSILHVPIFFLAIPYFDAQQNIAGSSCVYSSFRISQIFEDYWFEQHFQLSYGTSIMDTGIQSLVRESGSA